MTVTAQVSVTFTAETTDEINTAVAAMNFPEGAQVSVSAHQMLQSGVAEGGDIVTPAMLEPEPITEPESVDGDG
jgi:hypothetical protein